MEKEFCKFLTKIGMIDEDTALTFIRIYNDIHKENSDINIFELSFQILITFFNNITSTQKNYMCHNIPLKFYEIQEKNKKNRLISLISKKRLNDKIFLLKSLFIWKNRINHNKKEKNTKIQKDINSFNKNNSTFKRNNQNVYNNNIYKIPYKNYLSNINILENKFNNMTNPDGLFLDNNISIKSNSQSFLTNSQKKKNNPGVQIHYNSINNINCKEIDKSSPNEKLLNIKKDKSIKNSVSTKDIYNIFGYKEQEEMKECTFKPKINNLKQNIRSMNHSKTPYKQREEEIQSRFDKLYYDNEKYKIIKQIKAIEYDHFANKELTFNPNINYTPNLMKDERNKKFEKRIKTFLENKAKHSNIIKHKMNEEFNKSYSFSPKINKSYSNNALFSKTYNEKNESDSMSTIPAYIRLYEESKIRNRKYLERKKEIDESINNLSSSLLKKLNAGVNINKINELYENKKKAIIDEKTKNKVEYEEGITFKPYIRKNKFAKNIYSNFYERNSRFLEDKEKFININQKFLNPKAKISKNDNKEIVKNIINRLYNDSNYGSMNNYAGCNKYIKSVQGSVTNLNVLDNKDNN